MPFFEIGMKTDLSSPEATAEFSKFTVILSAALSQHHLSGFEIAQLTHVYLWQIHFDIWQNQYNIVKLNKIRFKKN